LHWKYQNLNSSKILSFIQMTSSHELLQHINMCMCFVLIWKVEVPVVVDSTEVGGCVTTNVWVCVVPVVGDVCTVVVTSVTVGLVVLTDTVVDPLVDVVNSGTVVVSPGTVSRTQ
jgi:hypothetical protein